jgi:sec-independent protein translocase protein TatA
MGELQPTHLLLVLLVALLLFGGSRVSALGKGLGEAVRDFKKGLREDDRGEDAEQKS